MPCHARWQQGWCGSALREVARQEFADFLLQPAFERQQGQAECGHDGDVVVVDVDVAVQAGAAEGHALVLPVACDRVFARQLVGDALDLSVGVVVAHGMGMLNVDRRHGAGSWQAYPIVAQRPLHCHALNNDDVPAWSQRA